MDPPGQEGCGEVTMLWARTPRHDHEAVEDAHVRLGRDAQSQPGLDPPGRVATGRAAKRFAKAVERLKVVAPAADEGRKDVQLQGDEGLAVAESFHAGRCKMALDPSEGDAELEGRRCEMTRLLTAHTTYGA